MSNYKRSQTSNDKGVYKGKNKRYRGRGNSKTTYSDEYASSKSKLHNVETEDVNSPDWYAYNPALLAASASFSFNNAIGSGIPLEFPIGQLGSTDYYAPGICAYYMCGVPGVGTGETDAVNLAASNIYSYVRYLNSGSKNYEPADLMLYLLAMDNIYSYYAWLKRLYGEVMVYSQWNKYIPKKLFDAEGVDFEDIRANLADYRAWVNLFGAQISSFFVPASMPYMRRHYELYNSLFLDSPLVKGAIYMYVPYGFHKFKPYEQETGGMLEFLPIQKQAKLTFSQLRDFGNELLNGILNIDDMNVMSGDIYKAYGSAGTFKLENLPESYVIVPTYSPEMIAQIQNATILNCNFRNATQVSTELNISQANGLLNFAPVLTLNKFTAPYGDGRRIINFKHSDTPTPADVMVGTRLCNTGTITDNVKYTVTSCGSELVLAAVLYTIGGEADLSFGYSIELSDMVTAITVIGKLTTFNSHPTVFATWSDADTPTKKICYPIAQLENYRLFSANDLRMLNDTAILSEFAIPALGFGS